MSNAVQIVNRNQDLTSQFTPQQLQLITATVARGASPDELQLFLYRCNLMKLNPLKPGQIHFIKYGSSPGTVVVGIEGFRSTAARTGKHVSTTRGVIRGDGGISAGWARVKRRDQAGEVQEYYEESPFAEYNNDRNPSWKKMPETMIKKVAEAACLRMAYPDDLGGIYCDAEEDVIIKAQDELPAPRIAPDQPNADEGNPDHVPDYTPGFGQWSRYTLAEIARNNPSDKIESYLMKLEQYIEEGKYPENHEKIKDFIARMSAHMASVEMDVP